MSSVVLCQVGLLDVGSQQSQSFGVACHRAHQHSRVRQSLNTLGSKRLVVIQRCQIAEPSVGVDNFGGENSPSTTTG